MLSARERTDLHDVWILHSLYLLSPRRPVGGGGPSDTRFCAADERELDAWEVGMIDTATELCNNAFVWSYIYIGLMIILVYNVI